MYVYYIHSIVRIILYTGCLTGIYTEISPVLIVRNKLGFFYEHPWIKATKIFHCIHDF